MPDNTISVDLSTLNEVGNNVRAALVGDKLVIVIDTSVKIGLSSTGKMIGYGSTGGFSELPGNFKGNVYVGKKA